MKTVGVLLCVLLIVVVPAMAQTSDSPAAYLPANTPVYFELKVDEVGLDALRDMLRDFNSIATPQSDDVDPLGQYLFGSGGGFALPGLDEPEDYSVWTNGRIGYAVFPELLDDTFTLESIIVLPIDDAAGAAAFVETVTEGAAPIETLDSGDIYNVRTSLFLGVSERAIWLGTEPPVEAAMAAEGGDTLADAEWLNDVQQQLPADALMAGYANREWAEAQVPIANDIELAPGLSFNTAFEAALHIHPAESAMEEAFLQLPDFVGAGFTLNYTEGQLDISGVAVVDAEYPAPTLATDTAGAALLEFVPMDSVLIVDTYDLSLLSLPVGLLALMQPVIDNVFESIVFSLENPGVPTPTPTPSPTPPPPLTADEIVEQAQPTIQQIEALLGVSLEELYSLNNGEFAIALFPPDETAATPNMPPPPAFALWMQSSDPERLLDISTQARMLLGLSGGQVEVETESIGGIEVTLLGVPSTAGRIAYGILDDDVIFITAESYLDAVLEAATDEESITETAAFPNDLYEGFGSDQEAFVFMEISDFLSLAVAPFNSPGMPSLEVGQFAGAIDLADDGIFRLNATLRLEDR